MVAESSLGFVYAEVEVVLAEALVAAEVLVGRGLLVEVPLLIEERVGHAGHNVPLEGSTGTVPLDRHLLCQHSHCRIGVVSGRDPPSAQACNVVEGRNEDHGELAESKCHLYGVVHLFSVEIQAFADFRDVPGCMSVSAYDARQRSLEE